MKNEKFREVEDFGLSEIATDSYEYLHTALDQLICKLNDMDEMDVCATVCTIMDAYVQNHPEINKDVFYHASVLTILASMDF